MKKLEKKPDYAWGILSGTRDDSKNRVIGLSIDSKKKKMKLVLCKFHSLEIIKEVEMSFEEALDNNIINYGAIRNLLKEPYVDTDNN
jgi:hypothetical protein